MDKLNQDVDLLEKILSDIKNEFKSSSSKNPENPKIKELKAKLKNCIRDEYLSGDKDKDESDEKVENDSGEASKKNESTEFEKNNVDDDDGLVFEKKNENEKEKSDADVSREEMFKSQSTDEVFEKVDDIKVKFKLN